MIEVLVFCLKLIFLGVVGIILGTGIVAIQYDYLKKTSLLADLISLAVGFLIIGILLYLMF